MLFALFNYLSFRLIHKVQGFRQIGTEFLAVNKLILLKFFLAIWTLIGLLADPSLDADEAEELGTVWTTMCIRSSLLAN